MRNKEAFIKDFEAVAKEEIVKEVDPVEDAAHTMHHTGTTIFQLLGIFTKSEKPVNFKFEIKQREKTDNPTEKIDDFFYIGMEE
ncbi:hypothetical protein A5886_001792 [Enterococcus sp. 8G7_MSG3316]|uniref:Uncharacterized protein n=1 Tax=Candidatus Enterococcus testudinis TaxID=1834191 RepID=A0A242A7X5_9ENTE|nr:DUF5960 family protein [Enterococcus sp. 8G7_MSG3316]OTN76713.1 hypothetical protein A5886_001792 [Enterococcus sp. 8G7_MSG3316]